MFRPGLLLLSLVLSSFLSVVTPNRAAGADAALLTAPQELQAGGISSLTITTFDAKTRRAIDRSVVVTLRQKDTFVATLFAGVTGPSGHVGVPFDVPQVASGTYSVEARISGLEEILQVSTSVSRAPAILIETDKPIYKPSQTIQGRVLLVDNTLRPAQGDVELTIHDGKGIRIDRRELSANPYGVAEFSLDLASEVNFGVWKIRAKAEGVESRRDILVEKYTLPRFELTVNLERSWALVDEAVTGSVDARYFFGQDVQGTAVLTARRWVGAWEEYARVEGNITDGTMAFTLPPVGFVAGSPENSGQGAVTIDVEATDSTGHTQTTSEVLTITESSLVIGLIPRVRTLKPAIPFAVLVTAKSPEGQGLDATVTVTASFFGRWGDSVGEEEKRVSVADGRGTVELTPPADSFYAELHGRASRDGHATSTSTRLDGSYSSGNSFLSLSREDGDGPASIGSQLSFETVSTHPGTVYYEVYANGRTVLSDASESGRFSIAVTPAMVPKAKVLAYKINPDNEVAADSLSFDVNLASSIVVTADFDREQVRPGDTVTLTVDAGTGARALLGLSIVDQSVLALGRSRLHLGDVFAELERRFLEPKAEVHEGEPEARGFGPFSPPRVHGPLDIMRSVGLEVAASDAIAIPAGEPLWDFFDGPVAAEDAGPRPPARAQDSEESPPDTVRVRQYFPETWVWEPVLLTDESGLAKLVLTAPDSITSWQLNVVSSSTDGIGIGESELTVFQEFFVEPSLPYAATRGEEFPIKVDVFNYLDEEQEVALSFGAATWFELLGEGELGVTVPPRSATSVHFPIRPITLGEHQVELTASGSARSDAVRRNLLIVPEGVPAQAVVNGVIEAGSPAPLDTSFPRPPIPAPAPSGSGSPERSRRGLGSWSLGACFSGGGFSAGGSSCWKARRGRRRSNPTGTVACQGWIRTGPPGFRGGRCPIL